MATIQNIARLASQLFTRSKVLRTELDKESFEESLSALQSVIGQVSPADMGITDRDLGTVVTEQHLRRGSIIERVWNGLKGNASSTENKNEVYNEGSNHNNNVMSDLDANAPCRFIKLYECDEFIMSVFILTGEGQRIPIHDHPRMHGIIGILSGEIEIRSWSYLPDSPPDNTNDPDLSAPLPPSLDKYINTQASELRKLFPTVSMEPVHPEKAIRLSADENSHGSRTTRLTPSVGNIHEIIALGGPAAFLDILAPPYSNENDCQYFRELSPTLSRVGTKSSELVTPTDMSSGIDVDLEIMIDGKRHRKIVWLAHSQAPRTFWCSDLPYRGPPLNPSTIKTVKVSSVGGESAS